VGRFREECLSSLEVRVMFRAIFMDLQFNFFCSLFTI
jgi:hypothetical protein